MQIQRFEGDDVQEALKRAQIALGPDALIVKTNYAAAAASGSYIRRRRVEVLAVAAGATIPRTIGKGQEGIPEIKVQSISLQAGLCAVVALVGPTGSGKTSCAAKLASAALEGQFKVAMVSAGNEKIGAAEQFAAIARWTGCPYASIKTEVEARAAIRKYSRGDLVLVDFAGLSPSDGIGLSAQSELLSAVGATEVHLCIPLTSSAKTVEAILKGYSAMRPTQILLTKLDESDDLKGQVRRVVDSGIPLSYLSNTASTTGIMLASAEILNERIRKEQTA